MSDYVALFLIVFFGTASIIMFYYSMVWRQFEKQAAKVLASLPENVTGMGPWTRDYFMQRERLTGTGGLKYKLGPCQYKESTEQLYANGKPLLATDCYIVNGKVYFIYKVT